MIQLRIEPDISASQQANAVTTGHETAPNYANMKTTLFEICFKLWWSSLFEIYLKCVEILRIAEKLQRFSLFTLSCVLLEHQIIPTLCI